MNAKKMLLSLVPWVLFCALIDRRGEQAAGVAAVAAAALAVAMIARNARAGVKLIDATGVVTFGVLATVSFTGGPGATRWVADYGRGAATLVLAAVMLVSVATVPFTEQYARESVPREYWATPGFHAVNQQISALWGVVVLVMAGGHLLAGHVDPLSTPAPGLRQVDLLLNWALPVVLIAIGVAGSRYLADRVAQSPANERLYVGATAR